MGVIAKFLGLDKSDTVIAVGGDAITMAVGVNGTPWRMPAYVAVHAGQRRVLAVGEEAQKMRGREPENIKVVRFTEHGGFGQNADLAEAALRFMLRSKVRVPIVAPRVVVSCADENKLAVKDVCTRAGSREIITFRAVMAAALGAGLKVDESDFKAVFVLERDWCAFGLISLSSFVAEFEAQLGVESLLEEVALHAMATRNVALDLDALHDTFLASGLGGGDLLGWEAWLDELETGRVTSATYSEKDMSRVALPYLFRLRWHYRRALEAVGKSKLRDGSMARLHLFSPYAKLPGVVQLLGKVFSREVTVPESGEMAVVRGGQELLRNLDKLYRMKVAK
jgi:hypothetical protein